MGSRASPETPNLQLGLAGSDTLVAAAAEPPAMDMGAIGVARGPEWEATSPQFDCSTLGRDDMSKHGNLSTVVGKSPFSSFVTPITRFSVESMSQPVVPSSAWIKKAAMQRPFVMTIVCSREPQHVRLGYVPAVCASPALHVSRIKAAASVPRCRASVRGKRLSKEVQTRLPLTQYPFSVLDGLIDTIVIADECHYVVTDAADDLVRLDG